MQRQAEISAGANYTQAGMQHALTNEYKKLARNQNAMRKLTPEEREAIEVIAKGGSTTQRALRNLGKFDPAQGGMGATLGATLGGSVGGVVGGLAGGATGAGAGVLSGQAALGIASHLARRGATRLTQGNVDRAREALVGRGLPVRQAPSASLSSSSAEPASVSAVRETPAAEPDNRIAQLAPQPRNAREEVATLEREAQRKGFFEVESPSVEQRAAEVEWTRRYNAAKARARQQSEEAPPLAASGGLEAQDSQSTRDIRNALSRLAEPVSETKKPAPVVAAPARQSRQSVNRGSAALNIDDILPDAADLAKPSAKAQRLPMDDEVARMKRAEGMGFARYPVQYHGTNQEFDAFVTQGVNQTMDSPVGRLGVSVTDDPALAGEFADLAAKRNPTAKAGENIIPVRIRAEKLGTIELDPKADRNLNLEISATVKWAWDQGYDAIRFVNYTGPDGQPGKSFLIVKDPSQIRSVNAKFDPKKKGSSNLLASLAGLGAAAGLAGTEGQGENRNRIDQLSGGAL